VSLAAVAVAIGAAPAVAAPGKPGAPAVTTRPAATTRPAVEALALPSRQGHTEVADAARRTARALAARLGGVAGPPPSGASGASSAANRDPSADSSADPTADPTDDVVAALSRGVALSRAGDLDRAAAALDPALDAGARSPQQIADPAGFLAAHVTRVSIALARGEVARADALLARVLQYDPAFALSADEDSPRMRDALARAHDRAGRLPALAVATLGDACRGHVLVVARGLVTGSTELLRFDGCRLVAQAVVQARFDAGDAAALLDPTPRVRAVAPARSAIAAESAPFYRRVWFWTAVGAVVVGGGAAAIYAATRGPEPVMVVPHL